MHGPAPGSPPGSIDRTCRARGASSHHPLCSETGRHPVGVSSLEAALGAPGKAAVPERARALSSALIAWEEKKKRAQAAAPAFRIP